MKKRITALALAIFMVLGTVALAAGTEKSISVTPMDMTINGQAVTPTKTVRPPRCSPMTAPPMSPCATSASCWVSR